MSFDQLMQNAHAISVKAADLKQAEITGSYPDRSGFGTPPLDRFAKEFGFVEQLFEPFSKMPDPAKYEPYINELTTAMELISSQSDSVTQSASSNPLTSDLRVIDPTLSVMYNDGQSLEAWTGKAAKDFKNNFVNNFKLYAANQVTALSTMRAALQAHQSMWDSARTDIDQIAKAAMDQLDNTGTWGVGSVPFLFTVLSAVGTIGSMILTLESGGSLSMFTTPITVAVAGHSVVSGAAGLKITGSTAESIIISMGQSIEALRQHIQGVEQENITYNVKRLTDTFNLERVDFIAARPALADMSLSNFYDDMGSPPSS